MRLISAEPFLLTLRRETFDAIFYFSWATITAFFFNLKSRLGCYLNGWTNRWVISEVSQCKKQKKRYTGTKFQQCELYKNLFFFFLKKNPESCNTPKVGAHNLNAVAWCHKVSARQSNQTLFLNLNVHICSIIFNTALFLVQYSMCALVNLLFATAHRPISPNRDH